jgi:type IX secretion system PorP/SprF family membrane protein
MNTIKYLKGLFFVCLVIPLQGRGQDAGSGFNYQMTMISNPAVTGSGGDGLIRLSYVNYYPGNSYNLHSVYLSYDGYFPALHGGAGFYLSDNYLGGIVNELKGGFSYSYLFRAGKDLYIGAGLSASFYNRGYNLGGAVLPDQIDPLNGAVLTSAEALASKGRTILDLNTGFLFITGKIYGGIAVDHLAEPVLSETDLVREKLRRHLLLHVAGDIDLGTEKKLKICPAGKFETGNRLMSAGAGASLESNYLSISSIFLFDNYKNIDVQTGFCINMGNLAVFYNYRFNIISGKTMLPFSLLHHAGVAFRLNNVDKRKTVKTINFPNL